MTPARIVGLLLVAATLGTAVWLLTSEAFELSGGNVQINGLGYTSRSAVLGAIGLGEDASANVFRLSPDEMDRALEALPAISAADVRVALPDRLAIDVVERTPVLGLQRSTGSYVLDGDGVVVAQVSDADLATLGVPVIVDSRSTYAPAVQVGQPYDQTEVTAMLQLAAISPSLVGSTASSLALSVNDEQGYVMRAEPIGWQAVFGSYTPTLRPPDMIARQVECLRSLLARGESAIATIYLAPLDDRCGTFVPREAPRSSPSPEAPG